MKSSGAWALALTIVWMLACGPALAQDRGVPAALQPYMTAEEFRAAGLHKLNPAELAQFQAWFVRAMRSQGDDPLARVPEARPIQATDPRGDNLAAERRRLAEERQRLEAERRELEQERARVAGGGEAAPRPAIAQDGMQGFGLSGDGQRRMDTRIDGMFEGWDGNTRFRLENGQVWETVSAARWRPPQPVENPGVTIRSGMLGRYTMQVDRFNRRVDVRRVE